MERLGYRVVNVGERDIRMGYSDFARRTEGSPFTYLSANIIDRKTQEPVFEPHTVIEVVAPDGSPSFETRRTGPADEAERIGRDAGADLRDQAGAAFFAALGEA